MTPVDVGFYHISSCFIRFLLLFIYRLHRWGFWLLQSFHSCLLCSTVTWGERIQQFFLDLWQVNSCRSVGVQLFYLTVAWDKGRLNSTKEQAGLVTPLADRTLGSEEPFFSYQPTRWMFSWTIQSGGVWIQTHTNDTICLQSFYKVKQKHAADFLSSFILESKRMKTLQIAVAPISLDAIKINHQLKIIRSAIPLWILPSSDLFMCIQLLISLTSDGFDVFFLQKYSLQKASMVLCGEEPTAGVGVLCNSTL